MTPAEFKKKWARYSGKETAAYQEHFNDLCALLGQPSPAAADPTGSELFCFQKRVVKDAELFALDDSGRVAEEPDADRERGFADVWKRGFFAWEYKGKKKNLDAAYQQLLRYRESLLNPPLLVVCDFDRYVVRTNFNGTVQETHEFTNANIDSPHVLHLLRAVFTDPDFLKPQRTTAEVTEKLAGQIAAVARSLQERESIELADAKTRREHAVAQRKNLRIARFLNRIVFCFFAEDTGLLPANLVTDIFKSGLDDPEHFSETLEELFATMATGGRFGEHKIRHFNGHLFEEATVFQLDESEISALATAGEADWQFIQPSIMGNLFERGLDPNQRSQIGAHYTSEEDILTIVEPVLMAPLRREWSTVKSNLASAYAKAKGGSADRAKLTAFHNKLASITVLDPACGSGNFLYVSLKLLLDLEKEVIAFATQLGFTFRSRVNVQQLKAIELNAYAFELAQVAVQIGYLQWRRDNGFQNDEEPVLQVLDGFENKDALVKEIFRKAPKDLREARAEEHIAVAPLGSDQLEIPEASDELREIGTNKKRKSSGEVRVYHERGWPHADVIVSNPPFLGSSRQWDELGRDYCESLQRIYGDRVPGAADLCCYWFAKASDAIEEKHCERAGLLATQAIRGGVNREVLNHIKKNGDIFFAESDRDWILAGANVHVSMVGFDDGTETTRVLDGHSVPTINSNLTAHADVTKAFTFAGNLNIAFSGTKKAGDFDVDDKIAHAWLPAPNPNGRPNSDLLRPWLNGSAIVKRMPPRWIIDTGTNLTHDQFALYEAPYLHAACYVKPERDKNKRAHRRLNWWLHAETCSGMREALSGFQRFLATPRVSKFRIFSWTDAVFLPDDGIYVFARDDDYFFGVLHSRFHEVWARAQGTQVRERESGFRYTPTSCFETFPFPEPTNEQKIDISIAAKELNELRENWLNPPEWTTTRVLEFPGATNGPWSRFVVDPDARGIGTVHYPRLEPRDDERAKKLAKRTLTNLYNERPAWLANAHAKLDAAVAAAYGFPVDLTDEQILERLLALNQQRVLAEKPATKKQPRVSRAKTDEEFV
jgi:type II restriction/modification system DNA methylase subunit YeeA